MRKWELAEIVQDWGLWVDGTESRDELYTAYRYLLAYRTSRNLPIVYPESVDHRHTPRLVSPVSVAKGA